MAIGSLVFLLWLGGARVPSAPRAVADHADGNMPESVNYWVVGGTLAVCNSSTNVSTDQLNSAISSWNSGVGGAILVSGCTPTWGVNITTVTDGGCGPPPPYLVTIWACADYPTEPMGQLRLRVESDIPSNRVVEIMIHELGHNLGFCHYPCNGTTCNPDSVMTAAPCGLEQLQQADKDNYQHGYHVDPVSFLTASSPPGGNQVSLTWDASSIHNENSFLIERLDQCTGEWVTAAWVGQNLTGWPLSTTRTPTSSRIAC